MRNLNGNLHLRRSIRLPEYDYTSPRAYFITVCVNGHKHLLGDVTDGQMCQNEPGWLVQTVWEELPLHYPDVEADAFVVMPNHVHGIIRITVGAIHELPLRPINHESPQQDKPNSQIETPLNVKRRRMLLPKVVGFFKMNTAKQINRMQQTPGFPVWQRNYYEQVIRKEEDLASIREYIINNPLRWELDQKNEDNAPTGY